MACFVCLVGIPQSGKSVFSGKLFNFMTEKGKRCQIVSDDDLFRNRKSEAYKNWQVEKSSRLKIKGEVEKHMSKNTTIIIDSINYFKGHRYELNVMSRNIDIEYCTVFFDVDKNICVERNEKTKEWDPEIMEYIAQRMEVPDPKNRMNKFELPIYNFKPRNDEEEVYTEIFDKIYELVFGEKKRTLKFRRKVNEQREKRKNNQKRNPEYVSKVERIISKIVKVILSKKSGGFFPGEKISVHENTKEKLVMKRNITAGKLMEQKKMFLKNVEAEDMQKEIESIPDLFIRFLNSRLV